MKWPDSIMLIRHDTSAYNVLKVKKKADPVYNMFMVERLRNPLSEETKRLACHVQQRFALKMGDAMTPLADAEGKQACRTGIALAVCDKVPDVIFVSPYLRAKLTLKHLIRGWPALGDVKVYEEERIREQEHGLALLCNDWKVFEALHPEQRLLRNMEGSYWYRYPQGENVPDVRERNRSWLTTLTREFRGKKVLVITHHLNILAMRANLERFGAAEFLRLDAREKPINCGVTLYRGNPKKGKDGRLELEYYNRKNY